MVLGGFTQLLSTKVEVLMAPCFITFENNNSIVQPYLYRCLFICLLINLIANVPRGECVQVEILQHLPP